MPAKKRTAAEVAAVRDRVEAQADRLAELLGVDPERIMFSAEGNGTLVLPSAVVDLVITQLREKV